MKFLAVFGVLVAFVAASPSLNEVNTQATGFDVNVQANANSNGYSEYDNNNVNVNTQAITAGVGNAVAQSNAYASSNNDFAPTVDNTVAESNAYASSNNGFVPTVDNNAQYVASLQENAQSNDYYSTNESGSENGSYASDPNSSAVLNRNSIVNLTMMTIPMIFYSIYK